MKIQYMKINILKLLIPIPALNCRDDGGHLILIKKMAELAGIE